MVEEQLAVIHVLAASGYVRTMNLHVRQPSTVSLNGPKIKWPFIKLHLNSEAQYKAKVVL